MTMRSRELEWKVSCTSIVSLHREERDGMMEGDGGSSNPIHIQKLGPHLDALTSRRAMLRIMVKTRTVLAISITDSTLRSRDAVFAYTLCGKLGPKREE